MTDTAIRLTTALADRYAVQRELGAGGMATVYLAHDLKHDRDVAIKVLHPDLGAALGGERFLSEIRTTARLQHPHILPLLDSGDTGNGLLYYVMPLVTGETLRDRLTRERQLPVAEAVRIAREVASALDYAHRQGVIHRDIKPENILLHDGSALVADFGIALAVQTAGGARMTQTGLSLGTPQYMSPEQAMGERTIDARADIYALAAVTYEMLAGDPPFVGSSVQAIVAKVMSERPTRLATLRDTCPDYVEDAVLTALAKLPADRFESAKAFGDALQSQTGASLGAPRTLSASARGTRDAAATAAAQRSSRGNRGVVAALGLATVASVALAAWALFGRAGADAPAVALVLELPPASPDLSRFAVSGDGTRFAFSTDEGIVLRDAGQREFKVLSGAGAGESPSFSPDGEWIAFESNGKLRKVAIAGGAPLPLIAGDSLAAGRVHWGENGMIVFETKGRLGLIMPDGTLRVLAKATNAEQPRLTPDGTGIFYVDTHAGQKLKYFDLARDTSYTLVEEATEASLLPTGHLLYVSTAGGLYAIRLDRDRHRTVGTPVPIAMDVAPNGSVGPFAISSSGTLVYRSGVDGEDRILLRQPNGTVDSLPLAPRVLSYLRFSPDGTRLAMTVGSARGTNRHLALYDFETHLAERITGDGGAHAPVWSPDGKRIAFTAETPETEAEDIFIQPADRSAPPKRMPRMPNDQHSADWPFDSLLVFSNGAGARTLGGRLTSGGTGFLNPNTGTLGADYLKAPWGQFEAAISPDRHWAAFTSYPAGKGEIHVRAFPDASTGGEYVVSTDGTRPRWSGDGRSIYHLNGERNEVRATRVTTGATFSVGATDVVMSGRQFGNAWDLDARSGRIAVSNPATAAERRIVVIQHWLDAFRAKQRTATTR